MGIGLTKNYLEGDTLDWGLVQWARPLISILFDANTAIADYQCKQLLSDRYHRCNPMLDEHIAIDDIEKIPMLIDIANQTDLQPTLEWLAKNNWG